MKPGYASTAALIAGAVMALAQEPLSAPPPAQAEASTPPAVLEYSGKPLVLSSRCTSEDLDALGLTCSDEEPCKVFLELAAVEAAGPRIFVSGNLHEASVTMFSILLASEDEGKTWREVHDRIRGAAIEAMQFTGPDTGWVSGEKPDPLPSDPFFLLTTDGGKSFRRRPVFSEDAESHLGIVQQFWFDSKSSGALVIDRGQGSGGDRYERYESPNGGETWAIKESSTKPIRLSRPGAEAIWRIRADAAARAFQIEHRTGARWTAASAFAVNAGVCTGK
jgi:hypothetical protein